MYPSSVVQTGVKFFGCENRMAQPLPIHSWKLIFPWVVSAVKLGASLLIRNAMTTSVKGTKAIGSRGRGQGADRIRAESGRSAAFQPRFFSFPLGACAADCGGVCGRAAW